jgi:competence protein ComEC
VSYLEDRRGFAEDCRRAAMIVSRLTAPPGCAAALVIDRTFLAAHGAVAIRAPPASFSVASARRPDEVRPWLPKRAQAASVPPRPVDTAGSAPIPAEPPADVPIEPELPTAEAPDGDLRVQ